MVAAVIGAALVVLAVAGGLLATLKRSSAVAGPVLTTTCADGESCDKLGHDYEGGTPDFTPDGYATYPHDAKAALSFYTKSCDGFDYGPGCVDLGAAYESGLGSSPDPAHAATVYARACSEKVGAACAKVAALYEAGSGVTSDPTKALALYQSACDGADYPACRLLGDRYAQGLGVAQDTKRALDLYIKDCEGGAGDPQAGAACLLCGQLYESLNGDAPTDVTMIQSYYDQSCGLGSAPGCMAAGDLAARGQWETANAPGYYLKACQLGDGAECMTLASESKAGGATPADPVQTVRLYRLGCQAKNQLACQSLAQLCANVPPTEPDVAAACQAGGP